jgi:glycosyltransferase involved in cell wall biosynthesis
MISIVMSYFNRLRQLRYTLKTIGQSQVKDYEIIIVEDFCDPDQYLTDIQQEFANLPIRIIRMQDLLTTKNYCNPCIPYNIGLRASRGDKILIQNPECAHQGDVLAHIEQTLTNEMYLTYHCYAATKAETRVLQSGEPMPMFTDKKSRWYNHVTERPYAYHFAGAMTRTNLCKLNGFDERFANGHDMDDVDLVYRINKLGLRLEFVADPWVVHQYHTKTYNNPHNPPVSVDNRELWAKIKLDLQVRAVAKDVCGS